MELKENVYIKSFSNLFDENSSILKHEISPEVYRVLRVLVIIFLNYFATILGIFFFKEIKQKTKFVFFDLKLVPFNADTNTRDNFQDKNAFISSKNQRYA
jgi:hypothetical protein